jgi:regulator of sigma E protease
MIAGGIYALASGQIPGGFFGPEGATGAIGIAAITYNAAAAGLLYWLQVLAALSVALGLANLLPLPALDGGRIVVVLLEAIRRRPFDREKEMAIQRWGLAAILALAALIAYFDIQRIVTHQFPALR